MILYSALYQSHDPFGLFSTVKTVTRPEDMKEKGVLMLHGGADISPSIYKQRPNKYCHADIIPSERDHAEMHLIDRAKELDMPIIGICRGAQLICAMDGGALVQHIVGHVGGKHNIVDIRTNDHIIANSAHHQMLKLNKHNKNVLLAMCDEPVHGYEEADVLRKYDHVPEVVYFPKYKALGIQGHPEWLGDKHPFVQYCIRLIKEFLIKE